MSAPSHASAAGASSAGGRVGAALGLLLVALWLAIALLAPWLAPYPEGAHDLAAPMASASPAHRLGTTEDGTDVLSALIWGARVAAIVGLGTALVSTAIGSVVGLVSGYAGGLLDLLLMRVVEIFLAFPGFLLALLVVFIVGEGSLLSVTLALNLTAWAGTARLVRGQVLSARRRDFITAARALGASRRRILLVHLLPNVMGPVIVQATFILAGAILAEASLSFLGLGPEDATSWGALLEEGAVLFMTTPSLAMWSGTALGLTVLGVNLLGDALRDRLDPR